MLVAAGRRAAATIPMLVSKILIISRDQVRTRMAAPGIRVVEMSRELAAAGHEVTLCLPNHPELAIDGVEQVVHDDALVTRLAASSDVVILGGAGHHLMPIPELTRRVPTVVDLSFPLALEVLAVQGKARSVWPPAVPIEQITARLKQYLLAADYLLCASPQQRQFYLGCLLMVGRMKEVVVAEDPTLRNLLGVVPFGCPVSPPHRTGSGPRDRFREIGSGDYVLLWSGSMGDWYDPETVVSAVALAAQDIPELRLVFMGARPDDAHLPETTTSANVRALAGELGLLNRNVFFEDAWVPYEERANWLLDADVAVMASLPTLESELAVRTRFLDYVWSATPVICTEGGTYGELIAESDLGVTVPARDASAMAEGIVKLSDPDVRGAARRRMELVRPNFTWPTVLSALVQFCSHPTLSSDGEGLSRSDRGTLQRSLERASEVFGRYRNRQKRPSRRA